MLSPSVSCSTESCAKTLVRPCKISPPAAPPAMARASSLHLAASEVQELEYNRARTVTPGRCKRRKMYHNDADIEASLPILGSLDYFTEPSIDELAAREEADPGYCSRVPEFVVGRVGYGCVRFSGDTDVRLMDLDKIVKLERHSVVVYEEECDEPAVGHGLNKPAEVTLVLRLRLQGSQGLAFDKAATKLRRCTERQGARFLSFDYQSGEWKFLVDHFSRFGLADEEEEDIVMDDAVVRPPTTDIEEPQLHSSELALSHLHPSLLRLDPGRMQEMRMLMFLPENEDEDLVGPSFLSEKRHRGKEYLKADSPNSSGRNSIQRNLQGSSLRSGSKVSPATTKKTPQALLEYNARSSELSQFRNILMTGQNRGVLPRMTKVEGFRLEADYPTPISGEYSKNIVDAALFMGRSFRVGWGPNGILVHTGTPVGRTGLGLTSAITLERVAIDRAVRDERNKIKEDLIDLCFSSSLDLHKSLEHETTEVDASSAKIKLQKVVVSRQTLPEICRAYIGIIEKQLEVPELSMSSRVLLMHQVTIWELIKVLFSERKNRYFKPDEDGEDMMIDKKEGFSDTSLEAFPFIRRAEFSYWLQDSVCHRVQEEVSCLSDSCDLEHILLLLTGRQLDQAVELAASRGDVRLSILLSQAGGSMVNRADMARQLDLWRINGLDFKYIENDRLRLYELLAGNIQAALQDSAVDWKRFLGLVMWYQLPPDTSLPVIIQTYQQLLTEGRAPHPVPVYIDEGPLEASMEWREGDRYDIAYYLMLLHANEDKPFSLLKAMFSAFSSTHDPLDYHMIWHQRSVLEAIGAFSSNDLHVLDMSLISQLVCLGQCHWAIYVCLHMAYDDEFPHIPSNIIREILFQYCETWSENEIQRQFIENLGIPSAWMHEALAVYYQYYGDLSKALEHFLESCNCHKAHLIFMTSVAHALFLSANHSAIWKIVQSMEEHKSEIADWDLGAGIYIDFYSIRDSLQEENLMRESDSLEKRNEECRNFFSRLNEALLVWGSRFPVDARATYSRMAEELCSLLASTPGESSMPSVQMSCFETMLSAPIPEDIRSCHLQEALSVFTYLLSGAAS